MFFCTIQNFLPLSCPGKRIPRRPMRSNCAFALSLIAASLVISGCGGGSLERGKASSISSSSSALSIGSKINLSMMPVGDRANAGIDWSVICGGNPLSGSTKDGACGTLTPTHTGDGEATLYTAPTAVPIGNTVTITAVVTSNPSQTSSTTLTVLAAPIAVAFSLTQIPSPLTINTTALLAATVTNDPLNSGVFWTATCGSAACGSFNPAVTSSSADTTYTAPATVPPDGTVKITATSSTDTTKSISTTVTIAGPGALPPPPPAISVMLQPQNIYVQKAGPGRSTTITAVVLNDSANAGVTWSLSCGTANCGNISSHSSSGAAATFQNTSTVSIGGTITITAQSTADPTKSATSTVTVVSDPPIIVALSSKPPGSLNTNSTVSLAATASPDIGNAGINWSVSCGSQVGCGSFNVSPAHTASGGIIVYTAPATVPTGSVVLITASSASTSPANAAVAVTTLVAAPPPPLSLSFTQAPPSSLTSATQVSVNATVANDVVPGGVMWNARCSSVVPGGCGWFSANQTASGVSTIYTAPPVTSSGTAVTITATSIGNPNVSISSNPIGINPDTTLAVNFVPSLPSRIQTAATTNLIAAVTNDSTHSGVDWQICPSGCGYFTIKPAIAAIDATATTPYVPPVPAVTTTTVAGWPSGLPIPYTAPLQVPSNGTVAVVATAHVDSTKANSGTISISTVAGGPTLAGTVQAGKLPVVGASVALYAAGTGGYGSSSIRVVAAPVADKNGNFNIPGGYTCPQPNSQMYLVASSGVVGQNNPNPNLALMTALGSCSGLGSGPFVVNEVTTIASVFAIAPFAADDALTGNSSYLYIGTSNTNLIGLSNAFAAVNNLVDISTGKVRFSVPTENAAVPYVEMNTLANMLNACSASSGGVEGDGTACGTLFIGTDLLGTGSYPSSIAPLDTLQAAFNLAQHPVANYGYNLDRGNQSLISLATPNSPFQPILSSQPNDWSISLNYTSGGGLSSASTVGSFAIDAAGNLWITDRKANRVIEWNSLGAALSPSSGLPAGGGPIAIDTIGNIWVSGNGVLTELTNLGSPLPWSPLGGVPEGGSDATFDSQGNLWIANPNGINEFNSLGVELSPYSGFVVDGITNIVALGIDSTDFVWIGTGSSAPNDGYFAELTNPGAQRIVDTHNQGLQYLSQIAADGQGNIWAMKAATSQSICEYKPFAGRGSVMNESCSSVGGNNGGGQLNIGDPRGVAIDGAGTVWVASAGSTTSGASLPSGVLPIHPNSSGLSNAKPYSSPSLAAGPLRVAVDGSGNIWVLLNDNTMTEYVGAAVPVVTPLSLGAKNKKLGARP